MWVAGQARETVRAASQATPDWVRWLAQRQQFTYRGVPHGLTGLPFAYFNATTGWNYGGRVKWTDYGRRPFRYKVLLHWQRSTEGKAEYLLNVNVPRLARTGFGLRVQADFIRGRRSYYGLGNDSVFDERLIDPQSPLFKDEDYYAYEIRKPRLLVSLRHPVRGPVIAAVGLGVSQAQFHSLGPAALLFEEQPPGLGGEPKGVIGLMLRWDTRDDESIAQRGTLHEWSYETSHSALLKPFFSARSYERYTVTDLRYFPLSERLNLANRAIFEVLRGEVPVDVYGDLGSLQRRVRGLGGSETLRGFDSRRFIDDVRFSSNTELRYRLHSQRLFRQYLEWQGAAFVDLGRVWPDLDAATLRGMRLTGGGGVRLYWNMDFVIRLETAISAEQTFTRIQLGNVF